MTENQKKDLETVIYFIPSCMRSVKISEDDKKMFLEYSERGLHKEKIDGTRRTMDGLHALIEGKKWRGIHIHEMWEPGILDGSVPYFTLLGGMEGKRKWWQLWKPRYYNVPIPKSVVDFMKREIFKGKDAETIEKVYQEIIADHKN